MHRILLGLILSFLSLALRAAEPWEAPLGAMSLGVTSAIVLDQKNCVDVMLRALQPNDVVKALVFMPGATDEFYMFHRARATVTNLMPSLLDAVVALTNQTHIRVTFRPPLLILHTDEDPLEPLIEIKDAATAEKVRLTVLSRNGVYNDMDWDHLLPVIKKTYRVTIRPSYHSLDSWHFFRHSFAAWNLGGWEALEAISMAGKERIRIEKKRLIFEGDTRVRNRPKFDPPAR